MLLATSSRTTPSMLVVGELISVGTGVDTDRIGSGVGDLAGASAGAAGAAIFLDGAVVLPTLRRLEFPAKAVQADCR